MKTLSVRNVPDEVYVRLVNWARVNHRSLQEQIRFLLEREVRLTEACPLSAARRWRDRLQGRDLPDIVQMVREDRGR
jgi:plasmid stability protein